MMPTQIKVHLLFTFHNVSINSDFCDRTRPRGLYLHSTMFLLILADASKALGFKTIFTFHNVSINSMMFQNQNQNQRKFTFHNVSINSQNLSHHRSFRKYLHSTMFLLIRCINKKRCSICIIYIPQCFY